MMPPSPLDPKTSGVFRARFRSFISKNISLILKNRNFAFSIYHTIIEKPFFFLLSESHLTNPPSPIFLSRNDIFRLTASHSCIRNKQQQSISMGDEGWPITEGEGGGGGGGGGKTYHSGNFYYLTWEPFTAGYN